tara:strand:+ start:504 stop:626 length:123 start_codon:yes stop_codon:yes gene_type:complete
VSGDACIFYGAVKNLFELRKTIQVDLGNGKAMQPKNLDQT